MKSILSLFLPAALALAFLPHPLYPAQASQVWTVGGDLQQRFRFDGRASAQMLGFSVASAGDLDGDGVDDLIVGAPNAHPKGRRLAGAVLVYSGATGAVIRRFAGQRAGDEIGWAVAGAGDLDGDGVPDLIVGAVGAHPRHLRAAGSVFIFSGATGAQLFRFDGSAPLDDMGNSIANGGDVDRDGVPDLVLGARGADPQGRTDAGSVFVFSGATGAQILRLDGLVAGEKLGFSVANSGDVDGDGVPDLIVGAPLADPGGLRSAGSAFLFSGATGNLIFRFDGEEIEDQLGNSVAGAGDVDGDGTPDLIIGAAAADFYGFQDSGSAYVFSGATGAQIFRFDGRAERDKLGLSVAGGADMDGDGCPDLIVGAATIDSNGDSSYAGSVLVFSGATGDLIFRINGPARGDDFGSFVAGAGDLDGDGRPDLFVGARGADPNGFSTAGSAFVYTFNPILTASAETLSLSAGGAIDYTIDFPDQDAGLAYRILLSARGAGPTILDGLAVPLTPDPLFLASEKGRTPPAATGFQGLLDPAGRASARIQAAPSTLPAKLIGRTLFLAAVNKSLDFSSVARRLVFQP